MRENRILTFVVEAAMSRRTLLRGSIVAAGAALASNILIADTHGSAANLPDDLAILNFALTLEHLEDVAYRLAIASGKLSGTALIAAQTYGAQEATHVMLLTDAIAKAGGMPVAEGTKYAFPAYTNQASIISFLRVLEDTGVGAYTGAARYIKDKAILGVAGGIVQVEARHAAVLRILDGDMPVLGALDSVLTPDQTLAAAGPLLGS